MFYRPALHILRVNLSQRRLIVDLVRREFRLRYVGSLFGSYWNFIHPLAMITIFTVIFSQTMSVRNPQMAALGPFGYTIYLCSGLLAWNAFVDMVNRGTRVFLDNATLIKKVSFPIEVLPTIVLGSASINFCISYGLFLVLGAVMGLKVGPMLLLIPVVYVVQAVFALGLAMMAGVLNVFFRDVEQVIAISFQIWFWLTPIVYTESNVPEAFRVFLRYNPFFYFVRVYHGIVVDQVWPVWQDAAACVGIAALTMLIGASFLSRFKQEIPDEL